MKRSVTHLHACQRAASQQKSQQIAQIELVIDGRHQQRQQGHEQHQAGAGWQNIKRALGRCVEVA